MSGKIYRTAKQIKKIYHGAKQIKKVYYGTKTVYSAGYIVSYHVDTNNVISKEVDDGADCIANAPSATKSGWTFHGWRENSTASSSVLSTKTCDRDGIHLYAVFKQTVNVTLTGGSSSVVNSGYKYYNNGNTLSANITLGTTALSGWTLQGYRADTTASSAVTYNAGQAYNFASSTTLNSVFKTTITLSYNGNGSTGGSTSAQTGTRYKNSSNYNNPSFTLRANGYSKSGASFTAWAMGSASGTQYSAGASVTLSANTTFYAVWFEDVKTIATTPANFSWWHTIDGEEYWDYGYTTDPNDTFASGARTRGGEHVQVNFGFSVNCAGYSKIAITCRNEGSDGRNSATVIMNEDWDNYIRSIYPIQETITVEWNLPSGATSVSLRFFGEADDIAGIGGTYFGVSCQSITLSV